MKTYINRHNVFKGIKESLEIGFLFLPTFRRSLLKRIIFHNFSHRTSGLCLILFKLVI
jgi:hypothetical protein